MNYSPKSRRKVAKSWWLEILAISFSVLSLITMLILLSYYDGRAFFSWHQVTINAVISIFATLARMLLLVAVSTGLAQWRFNWYSSNEKNRSIEDFEILDAASRGSWGSARLLWMTRSSVVVAIGAWVTLATIAFDPFVQQIVTSRSSLQYSNDNSARLALAQPWSGGDDVTGGATGSDVTKNPTNGNLYLTNEPSLDYSMQAAVAYGLSDASSNAILQQTNFDCPSGNCVWDEFLSLALCSKCVDVSSQIKTAAGKVLDPWNNMTTIATGHYLPNNNLIVSYQKPLGPFGNFEFPMTTLSTARASETLNFKNMTTLLFATSVLRAEKDSNGLPQGENVTGTECALYFCVGKYDSYVANGTLLETFDEVTSTRSNSSWKVQSLPAQNISTLANLSDALYEENQWIYRTDLALTIPPSQILPSAANMTFANISQAGIDGLSAFLNTTFWNNTLYNSSKRTISGFVGFASQTGSSTTILYPFPAVMQTLWNSTNLTTTFANLAASVSGSMRSQADNSTAMVGQTGVYQTFIEVRWVWVILPCACIAFGALFLGMVIWDSYRGQVPLWKNSALALLELEGFLPGTAATRGTELTRFGSRGTEYEILDPKFGSSGSDDPSGTLGRAGMTLMTMRERDLSFSEGGYGDGSLASPPPPPLLPPSLEVGAGAGAGAGYSFNR